MKKQNPRFEILPTGVVVIHDVTASFPHLDKPSAVDPDKPENARYSINALFNIDAAAYTELKKYAASKLPDGVKPADVSKPPFKEIAPDKLPESWKDEYGVSAFSAKFASKDKPNVIDANGMPIDPTSVYGGNRVSIAFTVYTFKNKFGTFIQLQLGAVMKQGDDLDFGGNRVAIGADAFGVKPVSLGDAVPAQKAPANADPFGDDIPF